MNRFFHPPFLLMLATFAGCAGSAVDDERLSSLLATERRFAETSATDGMNAAFLEFLADDAILFRPHPVNGPEFTRTQEDPPIRLTWHPTRARVSRAGDLGYTSGPYVVEFLETDDPPVEGYFVSVWKRAPGGPWRVTVDLGTENPQDEPCAESASFATPEAREPESDVDRVAEAAALLELERSIGRASDTTAELAGHLDGNARLYRDDECPVEGAVAVRWALGDQSTAMRWEPVAATVAASGDLAFSYGSYQSVPRFGVAEPVDTGYYVRIWTRDSTGPWRLALDVTSPLPDED